MSIRTYKSEFDGGQWVLNDGVVATPISNKSQDFLSVQQQFTQSACNLVNLWSVDNFEHRQRYEQQRERMAAKWGIMPDQVMELTFRFHSTKAPLDVVLVEGLRCDKAKFGLYGKGIYAASSVAKASSYWSIPFNRRVMLCVSMLVGFPAVMPPKTGCATAICPPCDMDSVLAFTNFHQENVVFDDSQVLITHFADYEVTPDYARVATHVLENPFFPLLPPIHSETSIQ